MINMTISGKTRMIYPSLEICDEVYIVVSPFETHRGRIVNPSNLKTSNNLLKQKKVLDNTESKMQ